MVTVSVLETMILTVAVSVPMSVFLFQRIAVGAASVTMSMTMTVTMLLVSVPVVVSGLRGVLLELNVSALVAAVSMAMVLRLVVIVELLAMDMSLESLVLVRRVVDSSLVAIGIDQLIVSGNRVAMS